MLHIFSAPGGRNEDFWFPAAAYFTRQSHAPGTTLFRRGEPALGFYLVERGILRAEYDLPQGRLYESIVAGTTCGELPFFSDTPRTATVVVDKPGAALATVAEAEVEVEGVDEEVEVDEEEGCVLWLLDRVAWERMKTDHAEVAQELLKVSLKLTSERMSSITSYILAMAG
jgi:SulP family sulfate permease